MTLALAPDLSAVDRFLEWSYWDRGRAPATIERYEVVLGQLAALGIDQLGATRGEVQVWWESRYGRSPATRKAELSCLRSFYRWATRFGHRGDDPTVLLDAPPVPVRLPRPMSDRQLRYVLDCARRDSLVLFRAVSLMAFAGCRVGEASAAVPDWIDVGLGRVWITGKGDKQRFAPLTASLLERVLPLPEAGSIIRAGQDAYARRTLMGKVNAWLHRIGVSETSHSLRKWAATRAAGSGASLVGAAGIMGWAQVNTIQHYVPVTDADMALVKRAWERPL